MKPSRTGHYQLIFLSIITLNSMFQTGHGSTDYEMPRSTYLETVSESDLSGYFLSEPENPETALLDNNFPEAQREIYRQSMRSLRKMNYSGQAKVAVGNFMPVMIATFYSQSLRKNILIDPSRKALAALRMHKLILSVYHQRKGKADKKPYYKIKFSGKKGKPRPSLLDQVRSMPDESQDEKEERFLSFVDELVLSGDIFHQPENFPLSMSEIITLLNQQATAEPRYLVFEQITMESFSHVKNASSL